MNTTENVTVSVAIGDNEPVACEVTSTIIRTDGITATGFATTYTFTVWHNGVLMQTLVYSVDSYVYAKKNDAEMGALALALYRYGKSAEAYKG